MASGVYRDKLEVDPTYSITRYGLFAMRTWELVILMLSSKNEGGNPYLDEYNQRNQQRRYYCHYTGLSPMGCPRSRFARLMGRDSLPGLRPSARFRWPGQPCAIRMMAAM